MLLKELAQTGVQISEVGIGTYDYRAGADLLRLGVETGAGFVDTAESYGTESIVGEALRGIRDRVFLATKVSPEHFREADLRRSVDASLTRLGVDVIDLLQLHYPNPAIPIQETMGAMGALVDAGKVRFCGVSNFSVDQLREAQKALGKHPVVSNQVRYNLIDRTIESGLLQYCQAHQVTVIAYSPLAKSMGRIVDCDPAGIISKISQITGKSPAQIAINWCVSRDGVVTIPKGGSRDHILENCASSDWRLSVEHLAWLDTKIQYRRRNRFDRWARQFLPNSVKQFATRTVHHLPRWARRRVL